MLGDIRRLPMKSDLNPLEVEILSRISVAGPMPVSEYMSLCLTHPQHGYYTTRDPIGARGDFITAPEVSQMFGELIGIWMAASWKLMGSPTDVRVIELGPGRGTLMKDALRAATVMPGFVDAVVLHLIEISPTLQAQQEATLQRVPTPIYWHHTLADVPKGPAIVIANEFFDALPIEQAIKTEEGWRERRVTVDAQGKFAYTVGRDSYLHFDNVLPKAVRDAPEQAIFEWRADKPAIDLGRRVMESAGAALIIDYGHAESAVGDTFQAVGRHSYANPLTAPGTLDLTAHVDFEALARGIETMGAKTFGPIDQAVLLRRLGIETRAARLKGTSSKPRAIDLALGRLIGTGHYGMGSLFKAMAVAHPKLGKPPAFDA
jgi:NADH dehydrogenase [ubiquinone] 1 alpha subcomplex assembly factor 7